LFQSNPRFSVEMESSASNGSGTSVELNLHQELEIAGQRDYRSEAAEKNLVQAQLSIEDAERLLRLEVTQTFYNLLAVQQAIADLKEVLAVQDDLLGAGQRRFEREDISILELNTLRLDRDQVQNELTAKTRDRVAIEKRLRLLAGLQEEGSVLAAGTLLDFWTRNNRAVPDKQNLQACASATRPDSKAARLPSMSGKPNFAWPRPAGSPIFL
jgi:outer membrane protein TolC